MMRFRKRVFGDFNFFVWRLVGAVVGFLFLYLVCCWVFCLIPDTQETVPGSRADGHAVVRHSQTAHSVVVTRQNS